MLLELAVVVVGITISFGFQEWREERSDRDEEARLLEGFAMELQIDLVELEMRSKALTGSIESIRDSLAKAGELDDEAIDRAMDFALGYMSFSPSTATYLELRQTGSSRLIRDKELLRNLIMLYERGYQAASEWDHINRTFVLDRFFPFIEANGPSFTAKVDGAYAHGYHKVFRALEDNDQFRNQLHSCTLFKEGQRVVYEQLHKAVKTMLEHLDTKGV